MKWIISALAILSLTSCNTTIGFGRDIRDTFIWAGKKMEQSKQPDDTYESAPVY